MLLLEVAYLTLEAILFGNEGFYLAMLTVDKRLTLTNLVGSDLDIAILALQRSIVVADEFLGIANLLLPCLNSKNSSNQNPWRTSALTSLPCFG